MIRRSTDAILAASLFAAVSLGATGCDMLDMYDQPRYEPLEASEFFADGGSARPIVAGTVPRGWLREDEALYTGKLDGEFVSKLPVPVDRKLFERGQERFNIYCSVCHGRTGEGDGMIVRRGFRKPPSLVTTERLLEAPAGHFFDVMTNGFGAMPSYASRVSPEDRWAIVAYIRALQLGQNGRIEDVPEEERRSLTSEQAEGKAATSPFAPRKEVFFAERKTLLSRGLNVDRPPATIPGRQEERP